MKSLIASLAIALLLAPVPAAAAENDGREQASIDVLKSDQPLQAKADACTELKRIGTAKAVPALGALLANDELSHCARYALESMPYPEVGPALLDALAKTKGRGKTGLIISLGERRESAATLALTNLMSDSDQAVATAAITALGKISDVRARNALVAAWRRAPRERKAVFFDALLLCAGRSFGRDERLSRIAYKELYDSNAPEHARVAAYRGMVLAINPFFNQRRGDKVQQGLGGDDNAALMAALQLVRELEEGEGDTYGHPWVEHWADSLDRMKPQARVALLEALAQRDVPQVLELEVIHDELDHPERAVRLAAIKALGALGSSNDVNELGRAAEADDAGERQAALRALTQLYRGDGEIWREIHHSFGHSKNEGVRNELLLVLAARRDYAAAPTLLGIAQAVNYQPSTRLAALKVLRDLAGPAQAPPLIKLLQSADEDALRSGCAQAISAAWRRAQKQGTPIDFEPLLAGLAEGDAKARCALMPVCREISDARVRQALRNAAEDEDARVREAAIRAMAGSRDVEIMDDLLALARRPGDEKRHVLALRGFLNLAAAAAGLDSQKRLERLAAGLEIARRPEEKKQALAGVAGIHTVEALRIAAGRLDDPAARDEAAVAACQIAIAIQGAHAAEVKAALGKILAAPTSAASRAQAQKILDGFKALEDYLVDGWEVSGPYVQEGKDCAALFDIPFAPEQPGKEAQWHKMSARTDPAQPRYLDLLKALDGGEQRVAYLRTTIESAEERAAVLEIGSDDGVKVWLNGNVVHANNTMRALTPGSDKVNVTLRKGPNQLLLKVTQNNQPWGATLRIAKR